MTQEGTDFLAAIWAELANLRRDLNRLMATTEIKTTEQVIEDLDETFAPLQHDNANHSTDFAPTPHDNDHHDPAFSEATHNHDATYAPTPHGDDDHVVNYMVFSTLKGTYVGTGGSTPIAHSVGFLPSQVTLYDATSGDTMYIIIHENGSIRLSDTGEVQDSSSVHLHPSDGFVVADGDTDGNASAHTYVFVAFV